MDTDRIQAYLQSACCVLSFEIGELWFARKNTETSSSFRFIQLYTSPSYVEHRTKLVTPADVPDEHDVEKHKFSPTICGGVCNGGQLVWANTKTDEGLLGRSDLPLRTAVGIPVCSIGYDLCILVLFSSGSIQLTQNAIEFLTSVTRAASEGADGFLPASLTIPVTPAQIDQFFGLELGLRAQKAFMDHNVIFQTVPLHHLQQWFDIQELKCLDEILELPLPPDTFLHEEYSSYTEQLQRCAPVTKCCAGLSDTLTAFFQYYNDSPQHSPPSTGSFQVATLCGSRIDARIAFRRCRERFQEFSRSFIGMTVFEGAEIWLTSVETGKLELGSTVWESDELHLWCVYSQNFKFSRGQDVPGQVLESGCPYWDGSYNKRTVEECPRALGAKTLGLRTAFGVPLPGETSVVGVLVFYTRLAVELEPLMVSLAQKAAQLLSTCLDPNGFVRPVEIDCTIPSPVMIADPPSCMPYPVVPQPVELQYPHHTYAVPYTEENYPQHTQAPTQVQLCPAQQSPDTQMYTPPYATPVEEAYVYNEGDYLPSGSAYVPRYTYTAASKADQLQQHSIAHDTPQSYGDTSSITSSMFETLHEPKVEPMFDGKAAETTTEYSDQFSMCKFEGCDAMASNRSPYCAKHTGTRRCQFPDCGKCAQGSTKYCIAHGGGRRCTFPGCTKGARDKNYCAGHGGGKRCKTEGCSKSAVGGSNLCTAHGGGKRCQAPGCNKSAQSSTHFCVRHGGGRKCGVNGCTRVARGRTNYCAAHGGGVRCRVEGCNKAAVGKQQLCRSHANSLGMGSMGMEMSAMDQHSSNSEDDVEFEDELLGKRPFNDASILSSSPASVHHIKRRSFN